MSCILKPHFSFREVGLFLFKTSAALILDIRKTNLGLSNHENIKRLSSISIPCGCCLRDHRSCAEDEL